MVSPMVNRKLKAIAKQVVMQCTSFENVLSPSLLSPSPPSFPPTFSLYLSGKESQLTEYVQV